MSPNAKFNRRILAWYGVISSTEGMEGGSIKYGLWNNEMRVERIRIIISVPQTVGQSSNNITLSFREAAHFSLSIILHRHAEGRIDPLKQF